MKPRLFLAWIAIWGTTPWLPLAPQQGDGDKTGTNPINFTYDWRTYFEMQSMSGGDNSLSIVTIEQRMPLSQKVQFRFRVRHNSLSLDPDDDGISAETSGLGDWDARVLWTNNTRADRRHEPPCRVVSPIDPPTHHLG